jgi:hypothetical protein
MFRRQNMQLLISSPSHDPLPSALCGTLTDMSSKHVCVKQIHASPKELSEVACDNASNLYFGSAKFESQ